MEKPTVAELEAKGYKLRPIVGHTRFPVLDMSGSPTGEIVSYYVNGVDQPQRVKVGELSAEEIAAFPKYNSDGSLNREGI